MSNSNRLKHMAMAGAFVVSLLALFLLNQQNSMEEQTIPVQKVEAESPGNTTAEPLIVEVPSESEEPILETVLPASVINEPEINGEYDINVEMEKENTFHITADITVLNTSTDTWQDVGFYFLPNAFTKENKPAFMKDSATVNIHLVSESEIDLPYELSGNKLVVKLNQALRPGEKQHIQFSYSVSLPENGIRFSKVQNNYYLTQWYPMIATYDDGWNIADYNSTGESYHTGYGIFTIHYNLFQPYFVVSSGVEGEIRPRTEGTVYGQSIKDFYLSFLDKDGWESEAARVNETEIRAFAPKQGPFPVTEYLTVGMDSFRYFEEKIGDNPNRQLDIIVNNGGMEYPNVVEVAEAEELLEKTIVHEVAHQWFYFLVANDPFYEAWLDEGMTEFTTSLYLSDKYGEEIGYDFANAVTRGAKTLDAANLPLNEYNRNYGAAVYGQTTLKLKDFFDANGGQEEAWKFLSTYYQENQYTISTTEHFADFFSIRYGDQGKSFLKTWLKLN